MHQSAVDAFSKLQGWRSCSGSTQSQTASPEAAVEPKKDPKATLGLPQPDYICTPDGVVSKPLEQSESPAGVPAKMAVENAGQLLHTDAADPSTAANAEDVVPWRPQGDPCRCPSQYGESCMGKRACKQGSAQHQAPLLNHYSSSAMFGMI